MQEPVTAPATEENMENEEEPIAESSAPVDMEDPGIFSDLLSPSPSGAEEEIDSSPDRIDIIDSSPTKSSHNSSDIIVIESAESSPIANENTENSEPIYYDKPIDSPKLIKSGHHSLDQIEIQSPPITNENKENLEPKYENDDPDAIIKSLKKMIINLKAKNIRDISLAKKVTRRDIVDRMSANYKLSLSKERKNHLKLLRETREFFEKRLYDVEKFYVDKIAILEENRTVAFDALLESKYTLEEQIKKSGENLSSIIEIISSYPSNIASSAIKSLPLTNGIEKKYSTTCTPENSVVEEINNKNTEKITQLETEVYEQKLRITCLENKIKDEITSKGQIQQKLAYTELLYRTTIREKDELIKNLQDDLTNLNTSKNDMESRHKEQFTKYDRMLKRSQAEIAVQKREVLALRTQFVPGTPTNFNAAKQKGTTPSSMIKQSTPSGSKVSSNLPYLLSESTPSFSTAASSQSSTTSIKEVETPSSKKSKSTRSKKAPSINSNSSAGCLHSEDSDEPLKKSARVLRTRRKR